MARLEHDVAGPAPVNLDCRLLVDHAAMMPPLPTFAVVGAIRGLPARTDLSMRQFVQTSARSTLMLAACEALLFSPVTRTWTVWVP